MRTPFGRFVSVGAVLILCIDIVGAEVSDACGAVSPCRRAQARRERPGDGVGSVATQRGRVQVEKRSLELM